MVRSGWISGDGLVTGKDLQDLVSANKVTLNTDEVTQ